jgi:hypothetical protein
MQRRFTQAGGCFLAAAILGGFVYGVATEQPMKGVLIGTGIGIGVALLTWLLDRAR